MKIRELSGEVEARIVYEEYDVIVTVNTDSLKKLERIISKIRRIAGVLRTITLIAAP